MNPPETIRPMLATAGPLPRDPGGVWAYEVKWDGMRVVATRHEVGVILTTRSGADASDRFPEVAHASLPRLPVGSVLDGEIVMLDDDGRPSFALLAPRIQARSRPAGTRLATYVVFDLLRLGSHELMASPYDERRRVLAGAVDPGGAAVVADSFDDGDALLRSTAERGLEGVVAKRRDSAYQPGVRSRDWVKVPHRVTASYVVGGWKSPATAPGTLRSLLVGTPVGDGRLRFDGAVGSGLSADEARILVDVLLGIESTPASFFAAEPPASVSSSDRLHWVEPVLVVDVAHLGRSAQGHLRQPAVVRLRPDLSYDALARSAAR